MKMFLKSFNRNFVAAVVLAGCALLPTEVLAQKKASAREEIAADYRLAGCIYRAYPGPQKGLTPAPKGKKPFYISHYGRHGSRWLIGRDDYTYPVQKLEKADSAGVLTPYGKQLLADLRILADHSYKRLGELSPLGAEQHQQIGGRMIDRFPEVFEGDVRIEARSSTVVRCILSMFNELQEMLRRNSRLQIWTDASDCDMWFIAGGRENLGDVKGRREAGDSLWRWADGYMPVYESFFTKVFTDTAFVNKNFNKQKLLSRIFGVATNLQNLEERHYIDLGDVFTPEQWYRGYQKENNYWFINYGSNQWTEGKMPYSQRFLLRDFIVKADSCIRLPKPGATLRFGHDTMVCPMISLLGINGMDKILDTTNFDEISERWRLYSMVPMAANIQFIFYRSSPSDDDVLVKVLLNEDEVPLTADLHTDNFPYYKWSEVRDYFTKKIDNFEK